MSGFDSTGPAGKGPMTGGGRGVCMTEDRRVVERITSRMIGFGRRGGHGRRGVVRGQGRGLGLGFRHGRSR